MSRRLMYWQVYLHKTSVAAEKTMIKTLLRAKELSQNGVCLLPSEDKHNLKYVAERTFNLMSISNSIVDRKLCDVLIEADGVEKFWMFDLSNIDEIFETGYKRTVEKLKEKKATNAIIKSKALELLNL